MFTAIRTLTTAEHLQDIVDVITFLRDASEPLLHLRKFQSFTLWRAGFKLKWRVQNILKYWEADSFNFLQNSLPFLQQSVQPKSFPLHVDQNSIRPLITSYPALFESVYGPGPLQAVVSGANVGGWIDLFRQHWAQLRKALNLGPEHSKFKGNRRQPFPWQEVGNIGDLLNIFSMLRPVLDHLLFHPSTLVLDLALNDAGMSSLI